jgi:hypothetical protein
MQYKHEVYIHHSFEKVPLWEVRGILFLLSPEQADVY